MGHLHRYQNLNQHGYPAVVYSGSIERVDFGERKEDKGFCFVKIIEKGTTRLINLLKHQHDHLFNLMYILMMLIAILNKLFKSLKNIVLMMQLLKLRTI